MAQDARFVYSVMFFSSPDPNQPRQKFFLFSSIAAIYELFSSEQVGCSLGHLYNIRVADGTAFTGKRCIIKRERLYSKHHKQS